MRYECIWIPAEYFDAPAAVVETNRGNWPYSTGRFNRVRLKMVRLRLWRESPRVRRPYMDYTRRDRRIIRRKYGAYRRKQCRKEGCAR